MFRKCLICLIIASLCFAPYGGFHARGGQLDHVFWDWALQEPSLPDWPSYVVVTVGGQFLYELSQGKGWEYAMNATLGNWPDIADKWLMMNIYHNIQNPNAYKLSLEQEYRLSAITIPL